MLSSKTVNSGVIEMYEGKPYIETVITLRSPVDESDPLYKGLRVFMNKIEPTMKGLNDGIEDILMEAFESDIVSIYSGVKNFNFGKIDE